METLTNVRHKCVVIISSPFRLAWQWQLLLQVLHSLVSVGLKCEHFQGFFHRRRCFWLHFINFISVARLAFMFIGCHMMPMTTAEGHYGKMVTTELFGSVWAPGLVFRGYANENSPVMVLINSSTTGPFKAVQELQKQETLIHDIINSSFFVFLISSSELFVFIPSQLLFSSTTLHCVLWCVLLFSYAL